MLRIVKNWCSTLNKSIYYHLKDQKTQKKGWEENQNWKTERRAVKSHPLDKHNNVVMNSRVSTITCTDSKADKFNCQSQIWEELMGSNHFLLN